MSTGPNAPNRIAIVLVLLAGTVALSGCASPSPIGSRRKTMGSLKSSLGHLEGENTKLRSRVANLESEKRVVEEKLVLEESANGDLTARLDDARNLLGDRGAAPSSGLDPFDPPTRPASAKPRRKPPMAQVPGRIEPAFPDFDDPLELPPPTAPLRRRSSDLQSRRDDAPTRWLPVVRGASESTSLARR